MNTDNTATLRVMLMLTLTRLIASFVILCSFDMPSLSQSETAVDKSNPEVQFQYYDPNGPKPSQIQPGLTANTYWRFTCKSNFTFRFYPAQNGSNIADTIKITSVRVSLALPMVITLPEHFVPKLKEHEEGHRRICEFFYEHSDNAARYAAANIIGRSFTGSGSDMAQAQQNAIDKAAVQLQEMYWTYTRQPAQEASQEYDLLTDHGRNSEPTDAAVQKAIKDCLSERNVP